MIGRDEPVLLAGTKVTLPEARSVAPPPRKTLAAAAAIVTAAADKPSSSRTGAAADAAAAAGAAAAATAGLPPPPSIPPNHPKLVTPTIQAKRDLIENDYINFYHDAVGAGNDKYLSEEEGLRIATIRVEKAKEATTRTAATADAAAAAAAALVAETMMKVGLEEPTETESVASGLRRNKICASAAVNKCGMNDVPIDNTVMIRCTQCKELMHGRACAHTVEDRDNYTCHKPECVMKRVELEETNQLITKEMEWTYAESFKNAKENLTAEMLQKEEEEGKRTQHKEVECSGHPNNPYMTLQEFNKYDLDNPPGLVSQFWIQHPDIVVNMMIHYVISGYTILISYKWHPSAFTHCNVYRPKEAKQEEKYVPLTMFDHINMCRKWSAKPNQRRYPKLNGKESDKKYTPVIADSKKSFNNAQSEIEVGKEKICVLDKMVNNLKHKQAPAKEIR